jgi:hypothetical protein
VPVRDLGPSAVIDHYGDFMGALERVLKGMSRYGRH